MYRVFNNDCTPSTAKINKTLAKLLLYYNSLNKVTLLCKVSDFCALFNFKNQELQISILVSAVEGVQSLLNTR